MSDTPMCQAVEIRFGCDIMEANDQNLRQKVGPCDEGSAPTPMEKSDSSTQFGESIALPNKCQPTLKAKSYAKVTSPYKPMNWA